MTSHQPSLTQRLVDQADRAAFANVVLGSEVARPHDHVLCAHVPRCFLREALAASVERINRDGEALADEYRQSQEV
jgi:hypothetical protein